MHGQNAVVDIVWPREFEIVDSITTLPMSYRFGEMLRGLRLPTVTKSLMPGKFIGESECIEMTIKNSFQLHENYYCRGYFQTAKFQAGLSSRGIFTNLFPRVKTHWYTEIMDNFAATSFTAMHIRLGDYLKPSVDRSLSLSYYEKSLDICESRQVLVFSDEPKKAFKLLKNVDSDKELVFLDPPINSKAIESLNLMSNANQIICSDSTFSWWGATLGRKKSLVVVPFNTWVHRELNLSNQTKDCLVAI